MFHIRNISVPPRPPQEDPAMTQRLDYAALSPDLLGKFREFSISLGKT
ncbi:hypothetical protein A6302_02442 [Methylobrevis pamukkalensis]|uniref:Uncharacterized protein n=1 Tax=Methylobrevis pamukkalensis TaxID=1439726 RepID=A0A1E3H3X5_9HYPH|nr:hypothetical protein A6302_02442 [Methylobrevis pamukkalensis]